MREPWREDEIRLVTYLKITQRFYREELADAMQTFAAQLPFRSPARKYTHHSIRGVVEIQSARPESLMAMELARLNSQPATFFMSMDLVPTIRFIEQLNSRNPREIAAALQRDGNFPDCNIDTLENLYWAFRRSRKISGDEPDEPLSWPNHHFVYLVDSWKELKDSGDVDLDGKVLNYGKLAELMDRRVAMFDKRYTALHVEKAMQQAIKWGIIRCPYATWFIEEDGFELKVNGRVPLENKVPPPSSKQLPSLASTGLLYVSPYATIEPYLPLQPSGMIAGPSHNADPATEDDAGDDSEDDAGAHEGSSS
ncbi:hypothetical protein MMC26_001548 [Xylographa opegraphella]|nr:hypothetical protein [Xylographa opegraphella]